MKKSLGFLIVIVIFGLAFLLLSPNMKKMKESTAKKNLVTSAKTYVDDIRNLWNSDAIYCDPGDGSLKPSIQVPQGVYYAVLGKNAFGTTAPVIQLNKVKKDYYGYVKIDYSDIRPQFQVFLTDGTYSIFGVDGAANLTKGDVKKEKLTFTFDSSYKYCKDV